MGKVIYILSDVEPVGKGQVPFFTRKSEFQSPLLGDFCRAERKQRTLVHAFLMPKAMSGLFLQAR
jgi:hypothetical protein